MRISSNMFTDNMLVQLNELQAQQNQLQNQASTGLSVSRPEDNPSAMATVLTLQTQDSADSQYQKNIQDLQSTASLTSNAINSLQVIIQKAQELATSSDSLSVSQMADTAKQINQLLQQAVDIGNTKDANGNYIFAGTAGNSQPPFAVTKDASGNITGVTYQGNTSTDLVDVSQNLQVTAQVPGANTTGSGPGRPFVDSRSGADLFNHLISFENDLNAGNASAISSNDIPALAKDESNVVNQISANGVVQSALESFSNSTSQQSTNIATQVSNASSADLATTLSRLSQTQTAYQAALQSGALVKQLTNLSFLP